MATLSPIERDFYDVAKGALPRFVFEKQGDREQFVAYAKIFARAKDQIDEWILFTRILLATLEYLDGHAKDRGTARKGGESEVALRTRLRSISDAVTPSAVLAAANETLAADGVSGTAALVELRRDRMYFGTDIATGKQFNYFGRGYRFSYAPAGAFIIILPYGTSDATAESVRASVRKKKAAGIRFYLEIRKVP